MGSSGELAVAGRGPDLAATAVVACGGLASATASGPVLAAIRRLLRRRRLLVRAGEAERHQGRHVVMHGGRSASERIARRAPRVGLEGWNTWRSRWRASRRRVLRDVGELVREDLVRLLVAELERAPLQEDVGPAGEGLLAGLHLGAVDVEPYVREALAERGLHASPRCRRQRLRIIELVHQRPPPERDGATANASAVFLVAPEREHDPTGTRPVALQPAKVEILGARAVARRLAQCLLVKDVCLLDRDTAIARGSLPVERVASASIIAKPVVVEATL